MCGLLDLHVVCLRPSAWSGTVGDPDSGKQEDMLHYMSFCFLVGKRVTKPERGGAGETPGSRLEQPLSVKLKSGLVEGAIFKCELGEFNIYRFQKHSRSGCFWREALVVRFIRSRASEEGSGSSLPRRNGSFLGSRLESS